MPNSTILSVATFLAFLALPECRPAMSGELPLVGPSDHWRNQPVVLTDVARKIHQECLLVDGHNDLPWKLRTKAGSSFEQVDLTKPQPQFHTDIPRLRQGGVGAQFWSAYVPPDARHENKAAHVALEQIDLIRRMVTRYPESFELALTADDVLRIRQSGKIAALIGVEGGHAIENSLAVLRMFHRLGARYMTLTHNDTIDWADAATDEAKHGGLTRFGEQVVRTMNELGMLVDISHVSAECMKDVLRVTQAPVIASHSSTYVLAPYPRNVPDDVLRLVAQNDGVVMAVFCSIFVVPESAKRLARLAEQRRELREKYPNDADYDKALRQWRQENPFLAGSIHDLIDHIDHIVQVAGIDHVGLGSDFDGVSLLPKQLHDVSCYPYITQALLDRGYAPGEIRKILGANALRALRQAEQVAADLQSQPSRGQLRSP